MNIEFHAHVYPKDYLKNLEASTGDVRIETDNKLSVGRTAKPKKHLRRCSKPNDSHSISNVWKDALRFHPRLRFGEPRS